MCEDGDEQSSWVVWKCKLGQQGEELFISWRSWLVGLNCSHIAVPGMKESKLTTRLAWILATGMILTGDMEAANESA